MDSLKGKELAPASVRSVRSGLKTSIRSFVDVTSFVVLIVVDEGTRKACRDVSRPWGPFLPAEAFH